MTVGIINFFNVRWKWGCSGRSSRNKWFRLVLVHYMQTRTYEVFGAKIGLKAILTNAPHLTGSMMIGRVVEQRKQCPEVPSSNPLVACFCSNWAQSDLYGSTYPGLKLG